MIYSEEPNFWGYNGECCEELVDDGCAVQFCALYSVKEICGCKMSKSVDL